MTRFALLIAAGIVLVGCATPPKPLRGQFTAVVPAQAASAGQPGEVVRWGGRIIAVQPSPQETCFEILGRDLSGNARPVSDADQSQGRFIACRGGFYDPAIFTTERDVTVTGRVTGFEERQIGEYPYRYPIVAADVIYLWPQQTQVRAYYSDPFWPGYHGYWWGHYHRPIVVRSVAPRRTESPPAKQ